ncbi:MAG: oligopeptide transport protein superfamily, atp bind [Pseudomonadota bacterium]
MSPSMDQHQGQGRDHGHDHVPAQGTAPALLEVREVSRRFVRRLDAIERLAARLGANLREQTVHAVDRVSFAVAQGEVVGLVGESGCGKSTLGRVIAGLHAPTEGEVLLAGQPVRLQAGQRPLVQMIFQDPFASLNPRMRVGEAIAQAPLAHGLIERTQAESYVAGLLQQVGLSPEMARRYPHQFSGGQRARVGIARALAVQPRFLVCDEAVAALDVSIQAQVINLLMSLRRDLGLTLLFISHDLGVIRHVCDRVVVMYLGRVVETGPIEAVYSAPQHPYTQALLAEVPRLDRRGQRYQPIRGEIPSPLNPPGGCHFHPRCPHAMPRCGTEVPVLRDLPIRLAPPAADPAQGRSEALLSPQAPLPSEARIRAACHLLEPSVS